jgi:hypothetical protein
MGCNLGKRDLKVLPPVCPRPTLGKYRAAGRPRPEGAELPFPPVGGNLRDFIQKEGTSMKRSTQQKIIAALALVMAVLMLLSLLTNILFY